MDNDFTSHTDFFLPEIWLKVNKHFLPTHTQWVNFTGAQLNQREGEKNLLQTKIF